MAKNMTRPPVMDSLDCPVTFLDYNNNGLEFQPCYVTKIFVGGDLATTYTTPTVGRPSVSGSVQSARSAQSAVLSQTSRSSTGRRSSSEPRSSNIGLDLSSSGYMSSSDEHRTSSAGIGKTLDGSNLGADVSNVSGNVSPATSIKSLYPVEVILGIERYDSGVNLAESEKEVPKPVCELSRYRFYGIEKNDRAYAYDGGVSAAGIGSNDEHYHGQPFEDTPEVSSPHRDSINTSQNMLPTIQLTKATPERNATTVLHPNQSRLKPGSMMAKIGAVLGGNLTPEVMPSRGSSVDDKLTKCTGSVVSEPKGVTVSPSGNGAPIQTGFEEMVPSLNECQSLESLPQTPCHSSFLTSQSPNSNLIDASMKSQSNTSYQSSYRSPAKELPQPFLTQPPSRGAETFHQSTNMIGPTVSPANLSRYKSSDPISLQSPGSGGHSQMPHCLQSQPDAVGVQDQYSHQTCTCRSSHQSSVVGETPQPRTKADRLHHISSQSSGQSLLGAGGTSQASSLGNEFSHTPSRTHKSPDQSFGMTTQSSPSTFLVRGSPHSNLMTITPSGQTPDQSLATFQSPHKHFTDGSSQRSAQSSITPCSRSALSVPYEPESLPPYLDLSPFGCPGSWNPFQKDDAYLYRGDKIIYKKFPFAKHSFGMLDHDPTMYSTSVFTAVPKHQQPAVLFPRQTIGPNKNKKKSLWKKWKRKLFG